MHTVDDLSTVYNIVIALHIMHTHKLICKAIVYREVGLTTLNMLTTGLLVASLERESHEHKLCSSALKRSSQLYTVTAWEAQIKGLCGGADH